MRVLGVFGMSVSSMQKVTGSGNPCRDEQAAPHGDAPDGVAGGVVVCLSTSGVEPMTCKTLV